MAKQRQADAILAVSGIGMSLHHARLNTHRWERVRRIVFARDKYRCRTCNMVGKFECDHIKPLKKFPKQDPFDIDGLQTICRGCHVKKNPPRKSARDVAPGADMAFVCRRAPALMISSVPSERPAALSMTSAFTIFH